MGDTIKYLYSQFILRDLLSFITPGAMVVLAALLLFLPEQCLSQRLDTLFRYSRDMHWLLYIPLFGVFYVVGFAVQYLGVFCGCIRLHKTDKSSIKQRFKMSFSKMWSENDVYREQREKTVDFLNVTAKADSAKQYHERSIVLKQMCANNSTAFIIAGVFLWVSFCNYEVVRFVVFSFVAVWLLFSLYFGYRSSEHAVNTIEDKIFKLDKEGKLREEQ